MATEEKKTYPKVSEKNWWLIWKKAQDSPSVSFTPKFISSICNVKIGSARDNVFAPLKKMGILNDDGKLTERGQKWRLIDDYKIICTQIIKEIYPEDLYEAFEGKNENRDKINTWFQRETGGGNNVSIQMAATYLLLSKADPMEPSDNETTKRQIKTKNKSIQKIDNQLIKSQVKNQRDSKLPDIPEKSSGKMQSESNFLSKLHIDIQIHISPDASGDQIDKIVESMAKHGFNK